jgi:hypothetical protein
VTGYTGLASLALVARKLAAERRSVLEPTVVHYEPPAETLRPGRRHARGGRAPGGQTEGGAMIVKFEAAEGCTRG